MTPAEQTIERVQQRLFDAAEGKFGFDQQSIAVEGLRWLDLILRKNRDYGSSAWKPPLLLPTATPRTAILVRMSDKIERLQSLQQNGSAEVNESFDDTLRDLGAYCLLYLAMPVER